MQLRAARVNCDPYVCNERNVHRSSARRYVLHCIATASTDDGLTSVRHALVGGVPAAVLQWGISLHPVAITICCARSESSDLQANEGTGDWSRLMQLGEEGWLIDPEAQTCNPCSNWSSSDLDVCFAAAQLQHRSKNMQQKLQESIYAAYSLDIHLSSFLPWRIHHCLHLFALECHRRRIVPRNTRCLFVWREVWRCRKQGRRRQSALCSRMSRSTPACRWWKHAAAAAAAAANAV
jgi:hypothetical protein